MRQSEFQAAPSRLLAQAPCLPPAAQKPISTPARTTRSSRSARRMKGLNTAAAMTNRREEKTNGSTFSWLSLSTTNAEAHARQT